MSGNAQAASGGGETFALARRGLPLAQANAALPRAPWLPAALRSRAQALRAGTPLAMPPEPTDVAADAELDAVTAGADMAADAAREPALDAIPAGSPGSAASTVNQVAQASSSIPPRGASAARATMPEAPPTATPRAAPDRQAAAPAPRAAAEPDAMPTGRPPARTAAPAGIDAAPAATAMPAASPAVAGGAAAPGVDPQALPARVQTSAGRAAQGATRTQTVPATAHTHDEAQRGETPRNETQGDNPWRGDTRPGPARRPDETDARAEIRAPAAPQPDKPRSTGGGDVPRAAQDAVPSAAKAAEPHSEPELTTPPPAVPMGWPASAQPARRESSLERLLAPAEAAVPRLSIERIEVNVEAPRPAPASVSAPAAPLPRPAPAPAPAYRNPWSSYFARRD